MKCSRCNREIKNKYSKEFKIDNESFIFCSDCLNDFLYKFISNENLCMQYRTKEELVHIWRANNPEGNKQQCINDTGLSRPTVYKYWNSTGKL